MQNRILATFLCPVLLAITPGLAQAGIVITLSDPNDSARVMTIQMNSVDISSITSASALETVLGNGAELFGNHQLLPHKSDGGSCSRTL